MTILATDGFSQTGIDLLEKAGHKVLSVHIAANQLPSYLNKHKIDVVLVKQSTVIDKGVIEVCPTLKCIGNLESTSHHIDLEAAQNNGIKILHADKAFCTSVAELTIAHLFSGARHLKDANRDMPLEGDHNFNALKRSYSGGIELKGKVLGIIGFGKIGQDVAKKAIGLGMKVIFYDKHVNTVNLKLEFFDQQYVSFKLSGTSFEEVLSESDFVSLHVSDQKQIIIGQKELALMKSSAGLINTSTGKVIDEVGLLKALDDNKLKFAALDTFENEPQPSVQLLMNPKLSLSPHLGGSTQETQNRIAEELAHQILTLKI